jgi:osmotically-inducible protein OsmY
MTQSMAATRTDTEIQQDVLREMKWDTRVEETEVGVEVDNGVVTLSGTVTSWGKRAAAEEAAHRVRGVLDVANDIAVKIPGAGARNDTDIAHAVRNAMVWDVFVPDTRIRSTVSNGNVTLEGDVDTWTQRDDAARAVRNLLGVRSVINLIEVKPPVVDALKLRKSIEESLERRARQEAGRVWFEVKDGAVKVAGTVPPWAEREVVIAAARETPGVRTVEDKLRIQPSF